MIDPLGLGVMVTLIVALVVALQRRERRMGGIDGYDGQTFRPKPAPLTWHEAAPYVACYTLYALLLVGVVIVNFTWWPAIRAWLAIFALGDGATGTIYMIGRIVLVVLGAIFMLASEPYLREGVARRQLMRRSVRLFLALGAAGVLGFVLQEIAFAVFAGRGAA